MLVERGLWVSFDFVCFVCQAVVLNFHTSGHSTKQSLARVNGGRRRLIKRKVAFWCRKQLKSWINMRGKNFSVFVNACSYLSGLLSWFCILKVWPLRWPASYNQHLIQTTHVQVLVNTPPAIVRYYLETHIWTSNDRQCYDWTSYRWCL